MTAVTPAEECGPNFAPGIPYACLTEIVTDIKANPLGFFQDPANYMKLFWASGCLVGLAMKLIEVNLLTPAQFSEAIEASQKIGQANGQEANLEDVGFVLSAHLETLEEQKSEVATGQFGIMTALTVLSAIGTIWKIYSMFTKPKAPSDDHSVNVKIKDDHSVRNRIVNRRDEGPASD